MESRSHALMAGLFTLALLLAVLLGGWWLNRDKTELVPYEMATKVSVAGLNPQAAVRYRGLDVGKVSDIRFDEKVPGQILVFFGVRPETPMTRSTYGVLAYQGVTGIAYVELNDDGKAPQPLPSSAENVARIEMRAGLLAQLQAKASVILDDTQTMMKELAMLFNSDNRDSLMNTVKSLNQALREIEKSSKELQPTLAKLPSLANNANDMMSSVTRLSNELGALSENLKTVSGGSDLSGSMTQLHDLAEDFHTSLQSLNNALDQFNQRPSGLLFGAPGPMPGPGEAGYSAPSN